MDYFGNQVAERVCMEERSSSNCYYRKEVAYLSSLILQKCRKITQNYTCFLTAENFYHTGVVFQETSSGISPLCCSTDVSFVKDRTSFISLQVQMSYKSILCLMQADKRRFIYCATIPTATQAERRYFKGNLLLCDTTTALANRTDDVQQ